MNPYIAIPGLNYEKIFDFIGFFLSFPVSSELSKNDIDKIRKIVREEVQREVGALRQEMNLIVNSITLYKMYVFR
ncbi:MAG: hypothetical protein AB1397_04985 [bacterium]